MNGFNFKLKSSQIPPLMNILGALAMIALACVTLYRGIFWNLFYIFALIFLGIDVFNKIIHVFTQKEKPLKVSYFLTVIGEIAIIVVFIIHSVWFKQFLTLVFGIWIVFNSLCRLLAFVIANHDQINIRIILFVDFLLSMAFGIILLSNWKKTTGLVNVVIGIYLLIFAMFQLFSAINTLSNNRFKTVIRFPLPIFFAAFIPYRVVTTINKLVQTKQISTTHTFKEKKDDHLVYINFYMKPHGHETFGHCDVGWNGKIYSYGCHDPWHRVKSQIIGEGVLIVANQEQFLSNEVSGREKTCVQFVCELDDDQLEKFKAELDSLMAKTVVFDYPFAKDAEHKYYITRQHAAGVDAQYYKFEKGWFRTYFVLTTNCVLLVEILFRQTGIGLFNINGIIVPGTYYDLLDTAYNQMNSFVIEKHVYTNLGKS